MRLEKIEKEFDLFGIQTHPIPLNTRVMLKMKGTKKNMNLFNFLISSNLKNSSSNLAKNGWK